MAELEMPVFIKKYWPQIVVSLPTIVLLLLPVFRIFDTQESSGSVQESSGGIALWLILLNLLAFVTCIAFAIIRPQIFAWRVAAVFNASLIILVLIASIFRFGA